MRVLNALIAVFAIAICFIATKEDAFLYAYLYAASGGLLTVKSIVLVISVCRFKSFIQTIQFAMPNECLMNVHFFNVAVYISLLVISAMFYIQFVLAT